MRSIMLLPVVLALVNPGPRPAENIQPNDNRHAAGTLRNGILTVALEARIGVWRPEGDGGRALDSVAGFAEVGGPLQTPGPLIRVPVGTEVRASIRNRLARQLSVIGFGKTRGVTDSVVIPPGETREVRFTANTAGTFYYAARSGTDPFGGRLAEETQLHGVIAIDPPGAPADRIFVMSWLFTVEPKSPTGLGHGTMAINGLSWPHTERLDYAQGDSVHWRVLNFTEIDHPMHLHGFYFRLDAKGNGVTDSLFTSAQQLMEVTQIVNPFQTIAISWKAERPGNWIFHCHYAAHLSSLVELDTEDGRLDESKLGHHPSDRTHQMYGLVMGISVAPRGIAAPPGPVAKVIRLIQREKPGVYGTQAGMSFVMDGTPEAANANALPVPGPTLLLERGKRVQITIANQSGDHGAVHWHGIELESFPDGVPGWSGAGSDIFQAIPPHDSLTVRWTPPRAGSFMYHSHFAEARQMGSGLYGPIIVLEPGQNFDPETDRILFFGTAGTLENVIMGPYPRVLMNGQEQPADMALKAGTKYRFRLFNLAGDLPTFVSLNQDGKPVQWRAVAKDGYPLSAARAITQPAALLFDPGEIYDFEFTPSAAGELTLRFGVPDFLIPPPPPPGAPPSPQQALPPTVTVPVHVR